MGLLSLTPRHATQFFPYLRMSDWKQDVFPKRQDAAFVVNRQIWKKLHDGATLAQARCFWRVVS
jgi:hypothetical protein